MQVKTFTAPTLGEAMELVRHEIGAEAVIVSARQDTAGAQITATLGEDASAGGAPARDEQETRRVPWLRKTKPTRTGGLDPSDRVRQALNFHGAPYALAQRLVRGISAANADGETAENAFQSVLEDAFTFTPLESLLEKSLILIGPPGSGKTVTVAKLAAQHTLNKGTPPGLITADVQRAGGIEQLEGFARILESDLKVVASPGGLSEATSKPEKGVGLYIDTPGTNPFSTSDMAFLSDLVEASGAIPVLTLASGGDVEETADAAAAFSTIGAGTLIMTRTDTSRRQGACLAAADSGNLSFLALGIAARIAGGLSPVSPRVLSRLFMPEIDVPGDWETDIKSSTPPSPPTETS